MLCHIKLLYGDKVLDSLWMNDFDKKISGNQIKTAKQICNVVKLNYLQ
jgi:hypothetical protein